MFASFHHQRLANRLRDMEHAAWVLTYDDCPEIRDMYYDWASIRPFSLRYAASERRRGREILITPRWVQLPEEQASKGQNPFSQFTLDGTTMDKIVKCYNPVPSGTSKDVYAWFEKQLANATEEAITIRNKYS